MVREERGGFEGDCQRRSFGVDCRECVVFQFNHDLDCKEDLYSIWRGVFLRSSYVNSLIVAVISLRDRVSKLFLP